MRPTSLATSFGTLTTKVRTRRVWETNVARRHSVNMPHLLSHRVYMYQLSEMTWSSAFYYTSQKHCTCDLNGPVNQRVLTQLETRAHYSWTQQHASRLEDCRTRMQPANVALLPDKHVSGRTSHASFWCYQALLLRSAWIACSRYLTCSRNLNVTPMEMRVRCRRRRRYSRRRHRRRCSCSGQAAQRRRSTCRWFTSDFLFRRLKTRSFPNSTPQEKEVSRGIRVLNSA